MIRYMEEVERYLEALSHARENYRKSVIFEDKRAHKLTIFTLSNNLMKIIFAKNTDGISYWDTLNFSQKDKLINTLLIKRVNISETITILGQIRWHMFNGKRDVDRSFNEIVEVCVVKSAYKLAKAYLLKTITKSAINDIYNTRVSKEKTRQFLNQIKRKLVFLNLGARELVEEVTSPDQIIMSKNNKFLNEFTSKIKRNLSNNNSARKYDYHIGNEFRSMHNNKKFYDWSLGTYNLDRDMFKSLSSKVQFYYEVQPLAYNGQEIYLVIPRGSMDKNIEAEASSLLVNNILREKND